MKKPLTPKILREAPVLRCDRQATQKQERLILLINPFYPKDPHASFGKHVLTPTLALTSVAGATPDGWEVRYWDENLLQGHPPWNPFPAVVGITVHLTFARRAYALADWYRSRGATVILGGLHAQSCPEELADHADAVAIGDGVRVWPQILADHASGCLKKYYQADYDHAYEDSPPPLRRILDRKSFLTTSSFNASRGCHNRCGFCYLSTRGLKMPYQTRRPEHIVEEFKSDDQPYGVFTDNNLGSDRQYLGRLCRALRPLRKIWSAAVSVDVADEPELIREMALAGCMGVFIGFESLSDENIRRAGKKAPRTEDYARRVEIFHRNGIQVNGSFVFGFDHDPGDVFAKTVSWIEEARLECATFHILTPYPGTPLFRQMEREGRLLHKNWDFYDTSHAVFRPRHMSPSDLEEGYAWAYQQLFSHRSIWRRRPRQRSAVLPYFCMSYLYKKSNFFWPFLIRQRWTMRAWRPLMEWTRRRHFRHCLALESGAQTPQKASGLVVPASV